MVGVGEQLSRKIVVDASRVVDFMGAEARVYGTPNMVADVELVCRDLLLSGLEPGQDNVGVYVSIEHLGPALIGDEIHILASVAKLDGRSVSFDATVTSAGKTIGLIEHIRAAVSVTDLQNKINQLQKKVQDAGTII